MKLSLFDHSKTEEIKRLFTDTFTDSEGASEGNLIGELAFELMTTTDLGDLYVFVATENEKVIGAILFSRLTFESKVNAFLLAPVAIQTSSQGKGVGQALINYGLTFLAENNVELVFTYGDPRFYSKTGFHHVSEEQVKAPLTLSYPHGWLGQSLVGEFNLKATRSYCVEAINKPDYW